MRFNFLAITLVALISAVIGKEESLKFLSGAELKDVPIYSMVWSAKSYTTTGKEQKTFFFACPFSFNTLMTINSQTKSINLNFQTYKNDLANFKYLVDAAPLVTKSTWGQFVTFSDGQKDPSVAQYQTIDLSLNLNEAEYTVERIKLYQNQTFRDIQVKLVKQSDKFRNALYVTFDFNKKAAGDNIAEFLTFLTTSFPNAKIDQ
jgi:hypothetical protein